MGFIGAGNYASSMLLPHLAGNEDVELVHVATTTSLSAVNAERRFGFGRASTDTSSLLDDDSIDAVFIVTRHSSHAELTCRALERGKTVFVEKPLALSHDQIEKVLDVVATTGNDRLMVGFNRRFAPLLVDLRSRFGRVGGLCLVRYGVNAAPLDRKSWYRKTESEGTRFEGEGGHFIDTVSWWLGTQPSEVHAVSTADPDDLLITLRFHDGSIATVSYATHGNPRYPKETLEVFAAGRVARLDNFRKATVWSGRRRSARRSLGAADKGQRQELEHFIRAVKSGGPMPISLPSLVATTRATLAVTQSHSAGRPVPV